MGEETSLTHFHRRKKDSHVLHFGEPRKEELKSLPSILRFISTARRGPSAAVSGRVHELWPSQAGLQKSGKRKTPQGNVGFRTEEGAPAWLWLQAALLLVNMTQRNYRSEINPPPPHHVPSLNVSSLALQPFIHITVPR